MSDGLRLALGTLTVLPVTHGQVDRTTAGAAMGWAPAVGVLVGLLAVIPALVLDAAGGGPLLVAVGAVAATALTTRGLHLDGLADTVDGLGSNRSRQAALALMRASDIGPFGVVALVLVLLAQVAAVADAWAAGHGVLAVVLASVTGRLAVTWACRHDVPAARDDGLGALVAGSVAPATAAALTAAAGAGALVAGAVSGAGAVRSLLAVAVGLAAAEALLRRAWRRLGGVTGDVLGALVETATTAALVVLALG